MFIIGLCLVAFNLPMMLSMARTLYLVAECPHKYRLTGMSEEEAIARTVIFFVLTVVGISLMVFGWMKRRNKATLDSIVNAENQNYCSRCNINISTKDGICPICGKTTKGE